MDIGQIVLLHQLDQFLQLVEIEGLVRSLIVVGHMKNLPQFRVKDLLLGTRQRTVSTA
jgi:hypothetical protein